MIWAQKFEYICLFFIDPRNTFGKNEVAQFFLSMSIISNCLRNILHILANLLSESERLLSLYSLYLHLTAQVQLKSLYWKAELRENKENNYKLKSENRKTWWPMTFFFFFTVGTFPLASCVVCLTSCLFCSLNSVFSSFCCFLSDPFFHGLVYFKHSGINDTL